MSTKENGNGVMFTTEQLEAKKFLLWLSFECHLGGNPADCPLHKLRRRTFDERRETIDQFSGDECLSYYEFHKACVVRKEKALRERELAIREKTERLAEMAGNAG